MAEAVVAIPADAVLRPSCRGDQGLGSALRTLPFAGSKDNNYTKAIVVVRGGRMCRALAFAGVDALPAAPWHVQEARFFFWASDDALRAASTEICAGLGFFFGRRHQKRHGSWCRLLRPSTFRLVSFGSLHSAPCFLVFTRMVTGGRRLSSCCDRLKDVLNLRSESFGAFRGYFSKYISARLSARQVQHFFRLPAFVFRRKSTKNDQIIFGEL